LGQKPEQKNGLPCPVTKPDSAIRIASVFQMKWLQHLQKTQCKTSPTQTFPQQRLTMATP